MAEVDFADGFDVSEPLLWGLRPIQFGTIVAAVVIGYLALRSPLPLGASVAVAVVAAGCDTGLALLRYDGRTLVSWVGDAARVRARPRRGLLVISSAAYAPRPPLQLAAAEVARLGANTMFHPLLSLSMFHVSVA
jgi:hypothetical protein